MLITEDVLTQEGRSERSREMKGSQVVSGLETGMERMRQKRPNSMGKEVTSCTRDRSQTSWSVASKKGQPGSVGAVKRAGGADEGGGVVDGFRGDGKLRCGRIDQGADHGRERCGNGEAVGYKGMADIRLRRS
jgi:hypothetical protein